MSIDGGPFVAYTGALATREGIHDFRADAVDAAGNRSPVVHLVVQVDLSTPVVATRLRPPLPARASWFRRLPTLVLRADDGDQNAGVASISYSIDGGAFKPYTVPSTSPPASTRSPTRPPTRPG